MPDYALDIRTEGGRHPPASEGLWARVLDILKRKNERYAVKGNSWQNVFPKHLRAYQDWWARLQAA